MAELDRERRYLVPVARLALPNEPDTVHLAVYAWEDRLGEWIHGTALCGRSTTQGALPGDTVVSCPKCLRYQPEYQAVFDQEARGAAPVVERVAARRDPRYQAVVDEIAGFGWPDGRPMVPGTWAETLATQILAVIRARETAADGR